MHVHGACHCGQIRFEAEVDPAKVKLCNCTDCQVLSGSAFRVSVPAPKAGFRLLAGLPSIYIKTGDSGNQRAHAFCPNCGAAVFASAVAEDPPTYTLRVGTLAERAQLPPQTRIWCRSALAWGQDVSVVPGQEKE
ncbi:aldehyde-activating protein [Rhodoferax koreense]|uniref:Aldehyde-activating protein n=1 Tax=Rhodoferax koreensis TaxID=1842727 RepID=A0A1P8JZG3_9BURK|nr:GFA family protein [Rhodoferax koreense]APW39138.1 aldehyde-activating protein [Rhodoferax koreense]